MNIASIITGRLLKNLHLLKNNTGFMKYFKNTSWLFGEKILRMIVGLFVGIWVARYLGPERFGLFSYAQSFVGLFTVIATLGLDSIVIRELIHDKYHKDALLGTVFWLKLFGAILVLLTLAAAVNFTSNDTYTNSLVFIIASATVFQCFNVIDFYYQAKVMGKYIVYANVISLLVSSIVKIVLILYKAPLIAFAWAITFDSIVLAMGYLFFYLKNHSLFTIQHLTFNKKMALSLLKDSWPLILSGMVIAIYMRIDQIMIKDMLGNEAVGQYAAAVRISEAWYFIPMVIASSVFPAIINAKKISEELYYARLQKLYDLMVWLSIAVALPMTFLSDFIIHLLYGEAYSEAVNVLIIHIWTGVFVFLGVASGKWFTAENLQMLAFWRTFYGMLFNVIFNFFMIPKYGIQGAAIATLFSYFIAGLLFDFFNNTTKSVFFMKLNTINPRRLFDN